MKRILKNKPEFLTENRDIQELSNYKTPAIARFYFEIHTSEDVDKIIDILVWAKNENIPYLFVSSGTNMLFAFDIFEGVIIKNMLKWCIYDTTTKILQVYGQEKIWDVATQLENVYHNDLWHRFVWLPGSVAGAIYWNAGCFWLEVENNIVSCEVLNLQTRKRENLDKHGMKFSYRDSIFKQTKKYFIISAVFDLSEKIEKYHSDVDNIYFRENMQPKWNSCGSFFKNPSREYSAGFLIEDVGLKWYHIGGAYFSEKHANFLMHTGHGRYQDLLELIQLARDKVDKKHGIYLENEVQIIYPNCTYDF